MLFSNIVEEKGEINRNDKLILNVVHKFEQRRIEVSEDSNETQLSIQTLTLKVYDITKPILLYIGQAVSYAPAIP